MKLITNSNEYELVRTYWDYKDKILYCELEYTCEDKKELKSDIWGIQQPPEFIEEKKNEYFFKPTVDDVKVLKIIKKNYPEFKDAEIKE